MFFSSFIILVTVRDRFLDEFSGAKIRISEQKTKFFWSFFEREDSNLFAWLFQEVRRSQRYSISAISANFPRIIWKSTLYAKCRGAWWSPVEGYRGNSFWFMRSSGYTMSNVTYVCDFGYLYNRGTVVTCDDAAVLPAITIDLSKANYQEVTPVYSTDINNHIN